MGAGPPLENKNAEKWTEEDAAALFEACLNTSLDRKSKRNDFIGEVAQDNDTNLYILKYLRDKYPSLLPIYKQIKSNCESNCFNNGKNNNIVASLAIMNLKSNHGWTDRVESVEKRTVLKYTKEEREARIKELANKENA